MVTGTRLGYMPLLFSYSVYIGCVVLQWCLRSHCGISKSQMVNLIPTCIVSSQEKKPKLFIYPLHVQKVLFFQRAYFLAFQTTPRVSTSYL